MYICPELAGHITCSRHLACPFMEVVVTSLCSEDLPATAEINQLAFSCVRSFDVLTP